MIERLRSHIASPTEGEIPEQADLVEEGYLDSMGLMDLVSFIESEFQVKVENDELRHENLSTLAACARFVLSKVSKGERRG